MSQRLLAAAKILGTLTIAAGVTFGLHRLGETPWLKVEWGRLGHWLEVTPPIDALLSGTRLVGLWCGWWILLSTCFYLAAGLCGASAALRLASPLTLPFIRNLSARVVVGAVAISTLGTAVPVTASSNPPVVTGLWESYPAPPAFSGGPLPVSHPPAPLPDPRPLPFPGFNLVKTPDQRPQPGTEPSIPPAPTRIERIAPGEDYHIQPGDHLWNIARRMLAGSMPTPPTNRQVAAYWVDLVEANRDTIRSGNPDLIYPGEKLVLPQIRHI